MHRCINNPGCHSIYSNSFFGKFNGQRSGHCVKTSFGQGCETRAHSRYGLIHQSCCYLHDVATPLLDHLKKRQLGDVIEPVKINVKGITIVFGCKFGEGLADEDAGIIDKGINPTEVLDRGPDNTFSRFTFADVTFYRDDMWIRRQFDIP